MMKAGLLQTVPAIPGRPGSRCASRPPRRRCDGRPIDAALPVSIAGRPLRGAASKRGIPMIPAFFRRKIVSLAAAAAAGALLLAAPARAASCGEDADGFEAWLAAFKQDATRQGISPDVVSSALGDVAYDDSVISHDRGQRAFQQSFAQFSAKRITAFGLRKGKTLLLRHAAALRTIEQRYGVPGPVLVAIWGLETGFGASSGNFQTFSALATLAYDCRRAEHFRAELIDALKIVQRGDLEPAQMRGAWAGEIGQTQFMPSSYLKYAVDVGGGRAGDIINNADDALASTANFLRANGWRPGEGWDEGEPNFAALLQWNKAPVYAKTIAVFADRLAAAAAEDQ
jgi:lytic murein transglycosylase